MAEDNTLSKPNALSINNLKSQTITNIINFLSIIDLTVVLLASNSNIFKSSKYTPFVFTLIVLTTIAYTFEMIYDVYKGRKELSFLPTYERILSYFTKILSLIGAAFFFYAIFYQMVSRSSIGNVIICLLSILELPSAVHGNNVVSQYSLANTAVAFIPIICFIANLILLKGQHQVYLLIIWILQRIYTMVIQNFFSTQPETYSPSKSQVFQYLNYFVAFSTLLAAIKTRTFDLKKIYLAFYEKKLN